MADEAKPTDPIPAWLADVPRYDWDSLGCLEEPDGAWLKLADVIAALPAQDDNEALWQHLENGMS